MSGEYSWHLDGCTASGASGWLGQAAPGVDRWAIYQGALPLAEALDARAFELDASGLERTLCRALGLALVCVLDPLPEGWAPRSEQAVLSALWSSLSADAALADPGPAPLELLRAALIMCAEHELNVSSFTARCAASAGTSPYGALGAAVAALRGRRHAGTTARIAAMFAEAGQPERLVQVILERRRRGDATPGLGHPLYPSQDPRSQVILEQLRRAAPQAATPWLEATAEACAALPPGQAPSVDYALALMGRCLGWSPRGALYVFGLGRMLGWGAHIMEQVQQGQLIRPRAAPGR